MTPIRFDYYTIHPTEDRTTPPGGMIALEVTTGPLRTVFWDPIDRTWIFDREAGGIFLLDDRRSEAVTRIDRSQAETIAREVFRTTLPSEAELHRMNEEGEAQANAASSGR